MFSKEQLTKEQRFIFDKENKMLYEIVPSWIDYKYDIKNEFFFMSVDEILKLALDNNLNSTYNHAKGNSNRYVYERLEATHKVPQPTEEGQDHLPDLEVKTYPLSPDAQEVLDMARDLVRKSFPFRATAHVLKPEMHLDAWDAGWYQVRNGILKEYMKEEYDIFVKKYKEFSKRLEPLVYELGFLKK
jgi:hypothetical protein